MRQSPKGNWRSAQPIRDMGSSPRTRAQEERETEMKTPSDRTIKRRLKELRTQIDNSKDPAVSRISYAMECGIRWAREETVDWPTPAETARDLAVTLHRELAPK